LRARVSFAVAAVSLTLAASLSIAALLPACFDFDATTSGGPLAPPDGSTGPYCASIPHPTKPGALFFCDDFDEDPLPGSWNVFQHTGGTLTETDASFVSPPESLDETTAANDGGQPIEVALRTTFSSLPSLPATLSFGLDLDPVTIDPTSGAAIVLDALDFLDDAGNRYSVEVSAVVQSGAVTLVLGEQSGAADGGMSYVPHPVPPTLPLASFTRVDMELQWSQGALDAKISLDGTLALDVPLTMTVQPSSLQIGVGTSYVSTPSPGWELRYDNVLFTGM
jgi:hypothetical protein